MVYILIAILIFGVLIAVHEFGHFLAAKACGVRVNEFSIGMGPQLFHKTKGDTEYSLRLLPIGGYCAMEGEDEDSDDDRALGRQVWWKKFIIFVAGAFMNFLTGLIIVICLYAGAQAFYTTEIVELNPDFPQQGEDGLMPGDMIYAINGERIYLKSDVSLIMGLGDTGTIDMTVLRDGKKLDRTLTRQVYTDENGQEYEAYGFTYGGIVEATPLLRLQYSWYQTMDYVRIVRLSLQMLLSGAAGVQRSERPGRHRLDHHGGRQGDRGRGWLWRGAREHPLLRRDVRGEPRRDEPAAAARTRRRTRAVPARQRHRRGAFQKGNSVQISERHQRHRLCALNGADVVRHVPRHCQAPVRRMIL